MTHDGTSVAELIESLESRFDAPNVDVVYEGVRRRARRRRAVYGGIAALLFLATSAAVVSQIDNDGGATVVSVAGDRPAEPAGGQASLLDRVVGVSPESAGALLGEAGFVLVDDSGATIGSGNDRNNVFGWEIFAYRQLDGSTGYYTTFNNYTDESLSSWQCGTFSTGSLEEVNDQAGLVFRSGEYPEIDEDEDVSFGVGELVDCGELMPVEFARLFQTAFTLEADGDELLLTVGSETARFEQVQPDTRPTTTTVSPETTVPQ